MGYILITGGNLKNKGAQSMIFVTVDEMRKRFPGKKIVVFAVGLNLDNTDGRMQLRDINFDKDVYRQLTCYYMGGAYVPDRIKGIDKAIMGMVRKMLLDKGLNMNEEERTLLKRVEEGCDLVSREQIEPVVEEFR